MKYVDGAGSFMVMSKQQTDSPSALQEYYVLVPSADVEIIVQWPTVKVKGQFQTVLAIIMT